MHEEVKQEYWADIRRIANFIIIDNDLNKDSDLQTELCKVLPTLWPILYEDKWVKKVHLSMWVIRFTDHLALGIDRGLSAIEDIDKVDGEPITPYSFAIAAACMGMDIIHMILDILVEEGANIHEVHFSG